MFGVNQKKVKGKPVPMFFVAALYAVIRASAMYLVLDNNVDNNLNKSSNPVVKKFVTGQGEFELFCYTPDLLKMWLRTLISSTLWCRTVTVRKVTKTSTAQSTYGSVATVDVKCLHIPTEQEAKYFLQQYPTYHMNLNEILDCANQLTSMLLNVGGPRCKLMLPSEVAPQYIPLSTEVASPNNIVKQDRLADAGYVKSALDTADEVLWDQFYNMEVTRFKYLNAQISNTRVTDSSIRSLNSSDREAYNNYAVSSFLSSGILNNANAVAITNSYAHKVSQGNAVNPALVSLQYIASSAKASKPTDGISSNKKYTDMINRYYMLTRHKLDTKAEKSAKSYPFRIADIQWMEGLISTYPSIRFMHDMSQDRPAVIPSSVQTMLQLQQQLQTQVPSVVSNQQLQQPNQVVTTQYLASQSQQPRVSNVPVNVLTPGQVPSVSQQQAMPNFIKPSVQQPQPVPYKPLQIQQPYSVQSVQQVHVPQGSVQATQQVPQQLGTQPQVAQQLNQLVQGVSQLAIGQPPQPLSQHSPYQQGSSVHQQSSTNQTAMSVPQQDDNDSDVPPDELVDDIDVDDHDDAASDNSGNKVDDKSSDKGGSDAGDN